MLESCRIAGDSVEGSRGLRTFSRPPLSDPHSLSRYNRGVQNGDLIKSDETGNVSPSFAPIGVGITQRLPDGPHVGGIQFDSAASTITLYFDAGALRWLAKMLPDQLIATADECDRLNGSISKARTLYVPDPSSKGLLKP